MSPLKEKAFALAWLSGILFARTTLVVVLDSSVIDGLLLPWFLKELIFFLALFEVSVYF